MFSGIEVSPKEKNLSASSPVSIAQRVPFAYVEYPA